MYEELEVKGRILLFDFNKPEKGVTELAFEPSFKQERFRPHGISVIQNDVTGSKLIIANCSIMIHYFTLQYVIPQ